MVLWTPQDLRWIIPSFSHNVLSTAPSSHGVHVKGFQNSDSYAHNTLSTWTTCVMRGSLPPLLIRFRSSVPFHYVSCKVGIKHLVKRVALEQRPSYPYICTYWHIKFSTMLTAGAVCTTTCSSSLERASPLFSIIFPSFSTGQASHALTTIDTGTSYTEVNIGSTDVSNPLSCTTTPIPVHFCTRRCIVYIEPFIWISNYRRR